MKLSTKTERIIDYFKIWFRDVGTIARLLQSPL